jgi:hypothetical protein
MFDKLAAGKTSITFGPQRIQNVRHSQGDDDLPRHCLAVGVSDSHPTPSLPFTPTVMISQFSALLLRRRCVVPLTRSRMLCMPAVASRTPAMTKARVSIQDTRIWHLTVVSVGLLGMVLDPFFLPRYFSSLFDRTCSTHVTCGLDAAWTAELSIPVVMTTLNLCPHRRCFIRL